MNQELIALFWVAVRGCAKHMAYRGTRAPTNGCAGCQALWEARQALEELATEAQKPAHFPRDTRCLYCALGQGHTQEQHLRSLSELRRGR